LRLEILILPMHHPGWDALFAAPVVLLALALGYQAVRRRMRGEAPPDDLDDDVDPEGPDPWR
jgi:hypothetical protein